MNRFYDLVPVLIYFAAAIWLVTEHSDYLALGMLSIALIWSAVRFLGGRWQLMPLLAAISVLLVTYFLGGAQNIVMLSAGIFLIATTIVLLLSFPIGIIPKPCGSFAVGFEICEFKNERWQSRLRKTEEAKKLQAYIWYPADDIHQLKTRPYHSAAEARAFGAGMKKTAGMGFLYSHFRFATAHSAQGATIAEGHFPLLVFNHGGVMWPTQNLSLMEEFASRGYIVISLAHPGETAGVLWADGVCDPIGDETLDLMKPSKSKLKLYVSYLLEQDLCKKTQLLPELTQIYQESNCAISSDWALDSSACLDWLEKGAPSWLSKKIDWERLSIGGMSIGGSAAFHACHRDERWKAGFNLDGVNWAFELAGQAAPVPFLYCYSDLSLMQAKLAKHSECGNSNIQNYGDDLTLYNDLFLGDAEVGSPPQIRTMWRGASHMSFSDCVLVSSGLARHITDTGQVLGYQFTSKLNRTVCQFVDCALEPDQSLINWNSLIAESEEDLLQLRNRH